MASNGNGPLTTVTHAPDHPDTTVGPAGPPATGALLSTPNGAVWAFDNLAIKFIVTPEGLLNGVPEYKITINSEGSFAGFADPGANGSSTAPGYGQRLTSNGDVKGTITYDVTSAAPLTPANLPSQEPGVVTQDQAGLDAGYVHLSGMINQLFGGSSVYGAPQVFTYVGGGSNYIYSYQHGNYVQADTITGDVVGH
jgi:hypothetical protein